MAAEQYPQDGYSLFGIGQNDGHQQAQLAAAYTHQIAGLRGQVLGKLAACGALEEGFGWAIFGGEDVEEGAIDQLTREVLIMSRVRYEGTPGGDAVPPLIRIITNEPVVAGDRGLFYITEDATILEGGQTAYMVGAAPAIKLGGQPELDTSGEPIQTMAPQFFVIKDNKLAIAYDSDTTTTPYVRASSDESASNVYPFGRASGNMEDCIYALNAARAILAAVIDVEPSHAHRSAA